MMRVSFGRNIIIGLLMVLLPLMTVGINIMHHVCHCCGQAEQETLIVSNTHSHTDCTSYHLHNNESDHNHHCQEANHPIEEPSSNDGFNDSCQNKCFIVRIENTHPFTFETLKSFNTTPVILFVFSTNEITRTFKGKEPLFFPFPKIPPIPERLATLSTWLC